MWPKPGTVGVDDTMMIERFSQPGAEVKRPKLH